MFNSSCLSYITIIFTTKLLILAIFILIIETVKCIIACTNCFEFNTNVFITLYNRNSDTACRIIICSCFTILVSKVNLYIVCATTAKFIGTVICCMRKYKLTAADLDISCDKLCISTCYKLNFRHSVFIVLNIITFCVYCIPTFE